MRIRPRPITQEDLDLPDYELGGLVLAICIYAEAEEQGISDVPVPESFAKQVITLLQDVEAKSAEYSAEASVLRRAARGEFESAGRLLKEHIREKTIGLATYNLLTKEIAKRLKQTKAGGAMTAKIRKEELAPRNAAICRKASELNKSGKDDRDVPAILAKQYGLHRDTIRRIIKKQ